MMSGWMIGVLLESEDRAPARRHFYAVFQSDQARAEWAAADAAMVGGVIASSPVKGSEPVEAVAELDRSVLETMGMRPGQTRPLGSRWPRRWLIRSSAPQSGQELS
jgi:hypothetical protein